jgi:hypothetical protein
MHIVKTKNYTYQFTNETNVNFNNVISWLETKNPIYAKLPSELLEKSYTGIITVYNNKILHLEIKIYEGSFIKIKNFTEDLVTYIQDEKIPLEIRINNRINKTNVNYIYDTYIIIKKPNNVVDIFYTDTMERGNFVLKNVDIKELSCHELNIYNKFNKIIKDATENISRHVDTI